MTGKNRTPVLMTSERASEGFRGDFRWAGLSGSAPTCRVGYRIAPWRLCQVAGPCLSHGLSRCREEIDESVAGVQGQIALAVVISRRTFADDESTAPPTGVHSAIQGGAPAEVASNESRTRLRRAEADCSGRPDEKALPIAPTNLKLSRGIIAGSGQGRVCEWTGEGAVARVAEFFTSVLAIRSLIERP
jgi:hypothetical protein